MPYIRPGYQPQWFHGVIADHLEKVYTRQIQRLMLFVPPQHGKSELSTRSFPAWVLGEDPDTKLVVCSYSATLAGSFNRDIQRRMDQPRYQNLFPLTRLGGGPGSAALRNSEIFEVVGRQGFVKTVGVGGSLTGTPVDIGIIDDPIKDRQEAYSLTVRESVWNWYTDVFETRLHNNSAQVLIMTRWHEDDPGGRLLARDGVWSPENPTGWVVVSFPALKTADENAFDPRKVGEALWPQRHSQAKIEKIRQENPITFNSLYQQDPKPSTEALIFGDWVEVEQFPSHLEQVAFFGGDFGFTNDPTVLVKIAREGRDLYVDELFYARGMTNPDILQAYHALKLPAGRESWWDGAEPKSIAELRTGALVEGKGGTVRLSGINAIGIRKGPGSIEAGINKLKEFRVHYTRRSLNLKREKNHYQWVMFNGVSTNVPIEGNDHAMDAIRGAVFSKFGSPSGGVKKSDPHWVDPRRQRIAR